MTTSDGSYTDSLTTAETGTWFVKASWEGDMKLEGSSSQLISFTVNEKKKGCIIATATYGSELSLEVQFLRGFRDNTVLITFAGRNFMAVFDAWYYSFSPKLASTITGNDALRGFMKTLLYPLIGILHFAAAIYSLSSFNPELAVIISGFFASSLISIVYFAPCVLLLYLKRKLKFHTKILQMLSLFWVLSIGCIVIAEIIRWSGLMMFSTALFVVSTMSLATLSFVNLFLRARAD